MLQYVSVSYKGGNMLIFTLLLESDVRINLKDFVMNAMKNFPLLTAFFLTVGDNTNSEPDPGN